MKLARSTCVALTLATSPAFAEGIKDIEQRLDNLVESIVASSKGVLGGCSFTLTAERALPIESPERRQMEILYESRGCHNPEAFKDVPISELLELSKNVLKDGKIFKQLIEISDSVREDLCFKLKVSHEETLTSLKKVRNFKVIPCKTPQKKFVEEFKI